MKRQAITASLGAAVLACSVAYGADKMSPSERPTDMHAKCEAMTGTDRLACNDQLKNAN